MKDKKPTRRRTQTSPTIPQPDWREQIPPSVAIFFTHEQLQYMTLQEAIATIEAILIPATKLEVMSLVDYKKAKEKAHQHLAWTFIKSLLPTS